MNDDTINQRRMQSASGHALIEFLAAQAQAAGRVLSQWIATHKAARRKRQAWYQLNRLSDRNLRDIGLERDQVDHLFL